jgi:signal transduction histidine kinase
VRLNTWLDRHPLAGDHVLAAVAVLLAVVELASGRLISYDPPVAPTGAEVAVALALVLPLLAAPRAPVAVFAVVMVTCLVQLAVTDRVLVADVAPLVALYLVLVHGPTRLRPVAIGAALTGAVAMSGLASFPGVLGGFVLGTAVATAYVLLAALLAERRLGRAARVAALERERDQQADLGAARERARIARDLHDVVAHSLAVMVAQADGGRYAATADPGAASAALAQIAATGRDALAQMRRLLGVLREGEEPGDLHGLVARLADAGLPVALRVEGAPRPLPADVRRCLHRVAQEALTNVLKHADAPQRVEVVVHHRAADVELRVRDDGHGTPRGGDGGGQGLVGMRERVLLQGGTLDAGPRPEGGFEVLVRVPVATGDGAEVGA